MRHRDSSIKNLADLMRLLKAHVQTGSVCWFRGQSDKAWGLVPKLAREGGVHLHKEDAIYKRFIQNATQLLDRPPNDEWAWLFLMQHHGAPTRLLDWTEGPLVALYFATSDPILDSVDSAFWCLDPIALNKKANLSFAYKLELPAFSDKALQNYLPSRLDPKTPMSPIAAIGARSTKRMAAQSGTFTINHSTHAPIETLYDRQHVWRYIIPAAARATIRVELNHLGYSSFSIFPDVDMVTEIVKREYLT